MTKFLTVLAASGAVALTSIAAPTTADARCRGCGVGIAAGVIGGIAAGAAFAASRPYYYGPGYAYDYTYAPGYYAPGYAYGPYYGRYYYGSACDDYTARSRQLVGTC